MRLTKGVRYALRMMLDIAKHGEADKPVTLHQVARNTSMPRRYLEQLVIPLKKACLLKGTTGRGGGYTLTRRTSEIKIGEIVEVMAGPIHIVECIGDPESCMLSDVCKCRPLYSLINRRIADVLYEYSLADMLDEGWSSNVKTVLPT